MCIRDRLFRLIGRINTELAFQENASLDAPRATVPNGLLRPVALLLRVDDVVAREMGSEKVNE